jgi:hypothetical protein
VVNILRNHGLRYAIYNLLPDDDNTIDYVAFGMPEHPDADHFVKRDGLGTYFDLLSAFFFRLNLSHPTVFAAAWQSVENNHTVHTTDEDGGTYASYILKEEERLKFEESKTDAFNHIIEYSDSLRDLEEDPVVIKNAWFKNREAIWWTGFTQSIEHRHPYYSKFLVDFMTTFIRTDQSIMVTEESLYSLEAKNAEAVVPVDAQSARNVMKWLAANFKANSGTGAEEDTKQSLYTSLAVYEESISTIKRAQEEEEI